jgi:hypothetical protein
LKNHSVISVKNFPYEYKASQNAEIFLSVAIAVVLGEKSGMQEEEHSVASCQM